MRSIASSIDVERLLHVPPMNAGEVRIPGDVDGMDTLEHEWHALKYRGSTAKELGGTSFLVEARVAVFPVAWHRTEGVSMHRCFCGEFGTL
mmetsp:Transcript_133957/g.267335  ORF Transcript_133957/g.267335 Transcript_133957/m.267335 type:complete len:91 (+) Transcript_133957:50-322(+)